MFQTLRANDLIWPYVVTTTCKGKSPEAFDLLYWNGDSTNLPGPMYCWYLRNMYLENNLCVPDRLTMCGTSVDLGKIDMPSYVLATQEDHIVPWRAAYRTTQLVGGKTQFVLGASGHIAGVINPASKNKRSYWIDGTLGDDAEAMAGVGEGDAGQLVDPLDAMAEAAGAAKQVPARTRLGNAKSQADRAGPWALREGTGRLIGATRRRGRLTSSRRGLQSQLPQVRARLLGAFVDVRGDIAPLQRLAELEPQEAARRVAGDAVVEAIDQPLAPFRRRRR